MTILAGLPACARERATASAAIVVVVHLVDARSPARRVGIVAGEGALAVFAGRLGVQDTRGTSVTAHATVGRILGGIDAAATATAPTRCGSSCVDTTQN